MPSSKTEKLQGAPIARLVRLSFAALFAAFIASGAFITIPLPFTPVPVSIQNLFALLAGLTLGPVYGAASVALYLLAGALGAPVFAGAQGGLVHFAAPSGGYLLGYLLCALTAGFIAGTPRKGGADNKAAHLVRIAAASAAGMIMVYPTGLLWLKQAVGRSWVETLVIGLVPFIIGDVIKIALAIALAPRLRKTAARLTEGR